MRKQDRAQRWRWGLLFALAGLAWLLLGGNDGEEFEFEDEDDAPQRLLASHVAAALGTPRYCRSDLPGCVPQQMEYILFLHIPEARGEVVYRYLEREGRSPASAHMQLSWCHLASALGDHAYCFSQRGAHAAAAVRERLCQEQGEALELLRAAPLFERLHCNAAAGMFDFSLLHTLPPDVLERTLVVINFQEPVARVAAVWRVMRQLNPAQMCAKKVVETVDGRESVRYEDCMGLLRFAADGFLGDEPQEQVTKRLAGDYCCYQPPLFTSDQARLKAALANLNRVGAVVVAEHMESSLRYLEHVMGWSETNTSASPPPGGQPAVAPADAAALRRLLPNDLALYAAALQRLGVQNQVLAGAAA